MENKKRKIASGTVLEQESMEQPVVNIGLVGQ